jgi:hypothetical protein
MVAVPDPTIQALYRSARDETEPMVNDVQRGAVDLLIRLAGEGNKEAASALRNLLRAPYLHPLLKEMITEKRRVLTQA